MKPQGVGSHASSLAQAKPVGAVKSINIKVSEAKASTSDGSGGWTLSVPGCFVPVASLREIHVSLLHPRQPSRLTPGLVCSDGVVSMHLVCSVERSVSLPGHSVPHDVSLPDRILACESPLACRGALSHLVPVRGWACGVGLVGVVGGRQVLGVCASKRRGPGAIPAGGGFVKMCVRV